MQGITKSGFEYDIDDRVLKDWRFAAAMAKWNSKKSVEQLEGIQTVVEMLFGGFDSEKYNFFMNHIASQNDGFVPAQTVMSEINEIFENHKVKN